jgi:hypothetical protein
VQLIALNMMSAFLEQPQWSLCLELIAIQLNDYIFVSLSVNFLKQPVYKSLQSSMQFYLVSTI